MNPSNRAMKANPLLMLVLVATVLLSCAGNPDHDQPLPAGSLRVEYRNNPLGIDETSPGFSWEIPNHRRGIRQQACQLLVAPSAEALKTGDKLIWDSGQISTHENIHQRYAGPALASGTRYYWTVRYRCDRGLWSDYADPGWFETGILHPEEWSAQWIGDGRPVPERDEDFYLETPNPLLRKAFVLRDSVAEARLYISGLGYFESWLNGVSTGRDVLHPEWVQYAVRVPYSVYDVTNLLKSGENVIAVMLGNGWYNPLPLGLFRRINLRRFLTIGRPKLLAELRVRYRDGSHDLIVSDAGWKAGDGPLLQNNVYLGEIYDARREQTGWKETGFDDSSWQQAIVETAPGGALRAQQCPPNRITRVLKPLQVTEPEPGIFVYDLGQNFAGWIRLRMRNGKPGQRVHMRFGELVDENGRVNGMTTVAGQIKEIWNLSGGPGAPKTAFQDDVYVMKGEEEEFFRHTFTFRAFRYVEIGGLTAQPQLDDLEGLRINSDLEKTGEFECSDPMLNRLQEVVEWTFLSNVFSVQSDCPGREKFGYGGDIVTSGEAFMYNFDMADFYRKTARDFQADARPNGGLTECAPHIGIESQGFGEGTGPVGWQLAHPFLLRKHYEFYGDLEMVAEQYSTLRNMAEFLHTQAEGNLIQHCIGDHVPVDPNPVDLAAAAFYYHILKLTEECAALLGYEEEAKMYQARADDIGTAFRARYLQTGTGALGAQPSQITQVFGLYYDLLPEAERERALDLLVQFIEDQHNGHLSTGIFSTKMLWDVLRRSDRNDLAYQIVTQRDFPGYGYMLENGATTLWENWDLARNQNSKNHPMFGSVSEWFYRSLLGINAAPGAAGFDRLIIMPLPPPGLTWARGSYRSVRGTVRSQWQLRDGRFFMEIELPGNTEALVYVPLSDPESEEITESGRSLFRAGRPAKSGTGIVFSHLEGRRAVFRAGAGLYRLEVSPVR
jgi:alpha-L-rhamnosidase